MTAVDSATELIGNPKARIITQNNKTFEFPTNYLKSMISSNVEFLVDDTPKPNQFNVTMIKKHNRSSSKNKKRSARRADCR